MTDKQQRKILEDFINDSPIATHIQIKIYAHSKSFTPRSPNDGKAHYEDANLLMSILMGAENFCYWLRRNGYKIKKG